MLRSTLGVLVWNLLPFSRGSVAITVRISGDVDLVNLFNRSFYID